MNIKDVRQNKIMKDTNKYNGGLAGNDYLSDSALLSPEQNEVLDLIEFCN